MCSSLRKLFLGLRDVIDKQQFTEGRLPIQDTACAELTLAISADSWPHLEHQILLFLNRFYTL